jgi:Right handed beta helix region
MVVKGVVFTAVLAFFCFSQMVFSAEPVSVLISPDATGLEIQNALDSLPGSGGTVILPAGNFEISQPIVLRRDHQTLRGAGVETVLRLADDANCPVIILGEPVNNPKQIVENVCVSDLFIDGNRSKQQRELWRLRGEGSEIRNNGIQAQCVSNSVVENVTCARCRSGGLVTTRGVRRLMVKNFSSFDNQFDGLACYQTEDCLFADLNLHDNPGAGISLDLAFNNNVVSNAVLAANDLGIFMRASCDNQFENVTIRDSRHFGVFMAHAETLTARGWQPRPQTECTHNAFTNLIAVHCGSAAFRVNNSTCTNNVLIGAQFESGLKNGLSTVAADLVTVK